MSFLNKLAAFLPVGKKEENLEYFFAVNIGVEKITAALWVIEGKSLKILDTASQVYSSGEEIVPAVDGLLDQVLGLKEIEPQKILFGVPDSWILDDNLKDEHLKTLRVLVKELELVPMAYVAISHALTHFLEKQEGMPVTAILVGFEKLHLTVTVVRAGKIDGVKVVRRSESAGADIEKALLSFTDVETLPSKILLYGNQVQELKSQLLSFSWMSKLSFLHFPKIDILSQDLEIKSVCLAGGSEINSDISYIDHPLNKKTEEVNILDEERIKGSESPKTPPEEKPVVDPVEANRAEAEDDKEPKSENADASKEDESIAGAPVSSKSDSFGFVVGDVVDQTNPEVVESEKEPTGINEESFVEEKSEETEAGELMVPPEHAQEIDDFEQEVPVPVKPAKQIQKERSFFKKFIPGSFVSLTIIFGIIGVIALIIGAYIFLLKANVKIFVEPKIVEKDAQVVADPNQQTINEETKVIPGQIIDVEISGSAKDSASGKRQIGDPAKGTIVVYNKTFSAQALSKGTQINGPGGVKFTLDTSVNVASQSATDSGITFGKANTTVTAAAIGADGNLPSGSEFTIAGHSNDKVAAKSEGNFSGGTSKDVTVVSSEDVQRLLAKLSSDLRGQAQQKLQEKYPDKKILTEALSESIVKKSYSKNINDQANEFSLNLTVKYKGTAFTDQDLKTIVSKLVITQVPENFQLDLSDTETQADVSKLEKDGRLVFLARFKAKLVPKIDTEKIKDQIKFKTPEEVINTLKGLDNVLGSEINLTPQLPAVLQRLPLLSKNIQVEVGFK